ncbi:coiled-coil domain-containing protein 171 [Exaiptasia diaphana]|uniref:Uncharacterized protein n=1 Tax=Exaiptasia diaphana TaxID=2652724 RepID=A0A913YH57_EXADI|nr:coiled-coil domain-containing protein 171 [Exaiptasia diaphana]
MSTSDWGSSFSEGRSSPVRRATPTFMPNVGNISPIHNDNHSPVDSGQTSPGLGDTPHNSTMKDDAIHEKQTEMITGYQREIHNLNKQVQELQMNKTLKDENDVNDLRRKIARIEEQQAEKTRAFNEQTSKLQSQVAKLRSALERGEATKQKLEYDLALANKASSQDKREAAEREMKLQKVCSEQKERINKLNQTIKNLETDLENCKQTGKSDDKKYRQILLEKDNVINQLQDEIREQQDERKTMSKALQEQANN